jgi:hypothetical protein
LAHGATLAFDPVVAAKTAAPSRLPGCAANASAAAPETDIAGGGLVSANGTYYSTPSRLTEVTQVTSVFKFTGTIDGTLTCEVMNDTGDDDDKGIADWGAYDLLAGGGFTAGVATLVAGAITGGSNPQRVDLVDIGFAAVRYKLVVTGGTGTIKERRVLKGR